MSFFKRSKDNDHPRLRIEVVENYIKINDTQLSFPVMIDALEEILGEADYKGRDFIWTYGWHAHGFYVSTPTRDQHILPPARAVQGRSTAQT